MKEITLNTGDKTQVDDEDFDWLNQFHWCLSNEGYAEAWVNGKKRFMHLLIAESIGLSKKKTVDHEDRNCLNNRRKNLRSATKAEQMANTTGWKNASSQYKGVSWDARRQRWRAVLCTKGRTIEIGSFDSEIKAAEAYNQSAPRFFGPRAYLNVLTQERP